MDLAITLTIVGSFLTIMLAVNAFFLKEIFSDLGAVKINIAAIFANSKNKDETIKEMRQESKEFKLEIKALEVRISAMEKVI